MFNYCNIFLLFVTFFLHGLNASKEYAVEFKQGVQHVSKTDLEKFELTNGIIAEGFEDAIDLSKINRAVFNAVVERIDSIDSNIQGLNLSEHHKIVAALLSLQAIGYDLPFLLSCFNASNFLQAPERVTRVYANACYDAADDITLLPPAIEPYLLGPIDLLEVLTVISYPKLTLLDLSKRDLRTLNGLETFLNPFPKKNNVNIKKFDISHNFIKEISLTELIRLFPNLEKVICSDNKIARIEEEVLNTIIALKKIRLIDLKGNLLDKDTKDLCRAINESFLPINEKNDFQQKAFKWSYFTELTEGVATIGLSMYLASQTKQALLQGVGKIFPTLSQTITQHRYYSWPLYLVILGGIGGLYFKKQNSFLKYIHDPFYQKIMTPLREKFREKEYSLTILI